RRPEPEKKSCPPQIHRANCAGDAIIDKQKGRDAALRRPPGYSIGATSADAAARRPYLMPLEKPVNFLRQFRSDAFGRGDLLDRGFPEPVHRTKLSQKQVLP